MIKCFKNISGLDHQNTCLSKLKQTQKNNAFLDRYLFICFCFFICRILTIWVKKKTGIIIYLSWNHQRSNVFVYLVFPVSLSLFSCNEELQLKNKPLIEYVKFFDGFNISFLVFTLLNVFLSLESNGYKLEW